MAVLWLVLVVDVLVVQAVLAPVADIDYLFADQGSSMKILQGKTALITGGSSGIGLALAIEIARSGGKPVILARRPEQLAVAAEAIQPFTSYPVEIISCDVTKPDQMESELGEYIEKAGAPDILINSAGVAHPGKFEDLPPEIFTWMMDVNYYGTVHACQTIVPYMIDRGSGHIVNISSMAGFLGVYGYTAYSASKFAVRGFTDALRSELKPHAVQVSIVFPPDTQTPQLEYEEQFKPYVTRVVNGTISPMSPASVAQSIVRGMRRNRYVITPGTEPTLFYHLAHLLAFAVPSILDLMVLRAIQSQKKQMKEHAQQD